MSERLPDRLLGRIPDRYRGRVPPEVPALWEQPERVSVLLASVAAMFALSIFPPYFSPGAEAIQRNLKQDPGSLGLVVIAGIALGAGTLLLGGATGDVTGHRRWLLAGLAGLLATCLFGMVFQSDEGLLIAGLLGAFWSGFAMPLGIAIVADAFPERTVQDIGIGLGLASMGVAQIVAPVIQDVLHDLIGVWAIYFLPLAAGSLAFYLVWSRVPERRSASELKRRHVMGQALTAAIPLTIATFLIVLLPGEADVLAMLGLLLLGAIGLAIAVIRRRRGRGIFPAGVTPSRMIIVALFVGVFMSFALNAPLLYFGSYLQIVRDWGEWLAVAALIPHIVPLFLGGLYAPVLTRRHGYVRVILASMLMMAAATALFALASAETTYWWFIAPLAFLGLGLIFGATAKTGLIMARMPRSLPGLTTPHVTRAAEFRLITPY